MKTPTRADRSRPLHEDPEIHRRRWFLLAMMCLSLVLVVMSISGLVTAIPRMQEELEASASQIQWILDAYAIVFAGALLMAGALGDRFGRKRALLSGLVVFGAGAIYAGLASAATQVIVGRAAMGIGAALVMPATLSIITTIFPPEERSKAIAMWAGFAGAGGAIGPIVSGALLESFWWGAAVLVNLPLVLVTFIAIARFAPESRDEDETPLDPLGAVLSLAGLGSLVFAIIQGGEHGWTTTSVLAAAAIAVVTLAALLWWERRTPHPMLPLTFFRDRRFSVGSGVVTLAFFVMFGFFFIVTQYMQFGRGYSPLEAGLASLPLPITFVAVSPRSALLAERFGAARVMAIGLAVIAVGFSILATVGPDTPYVVLAIAFAVLGAGMGSTAAPATGEIMSAVPMSKAGVGSAVNDTTRELGGALGIAILGSIANSAYRGGIDLGDLGLASGARVTAEESIGSAAQVAVDAVRGGALRVRAADAFAHAFNVTSMVSVAVVLTAAIAVLVFSNRREDEVFIDLVDDADEFGLAVAAAGRGEAAD
jgi:EmrB/QacA subfamily drug resistance transporter